MAKYEADVPTVKQIYRSKIHGWIEQLRQNASRTYCDAGELLKSESGFFRCTKCPITSGKFAKQGIVK